MNEEFFPWEDVDAARNSAKLQARHRNELQSVSESSQETCPKCSRTGTELSWFYFKSPQWTWECLCGRAGWMAVCDVCHVQVAFCLVMMN